MRVAAVVFDGFETLDVFGPVQILGRLPDVFHIDIVGPSLDPVASGQGQRCCPDRAWTDTPDWDILLVPGGTGARSVITDSKFLSALRAMAEECELVASVCTGSALLAAAGLLEGYRATTNKAAYAWATSHGDRVEWVPAARWVHDRDRWTSSGVSAGIDMALALVEDRCDRVTAQRIADMAELDWHSDPDWDPFAVMHGLVPRA